MKVIIIGAGIGGLCAALALQQQGIQVVVYEMSAALKPVGAGIGLATNAIKGLQKLGIAALVMQKGKQLTALQMLDENGRIISSQDTTRLGKQYGEHNFVIHRAELHAILLDQLKAETVQLGMHCKEVKQKEGKVHVCFSNGKADEADLLIAADGIHSIIRQQLLPMSKPRYAGYTCWRAVISDPGFTFNPMVSAETWAPQGRVGMAALPGNRIYWYCCINAAEKDERMRRMTPEQLAKHFKGIHEPIAVMLSHTKQEQMIWNDILDLNPLSNFVYGRIVLLGDAAHATTPNMGQGACQAIEDAIVLADCLKQQRDLDSALHLYEKRRIKRTTKVIKLSRLLGRVSQWQHPIWCRFRNFVFQAMPQFISNKQMKWLFEVDF